MLSKRDASMPVFAVPPATWSKAFLENAPYLALDLKPQSPGANALVDLLVQRVETANSDRRNSRQEAGRRKLRQAVGAIVGGVLRAWGHPDQPGRPVARSNQAEQFTPNQMFARDLLEASVRRQDGVVGRRIFKTVMEGLQAEGLILHKRGYRRTNLSQLRMGQGEKGKAACYWPTAALLVLAEQQGLSPRTIAKAFRAPAPQRQRLQRQLVEVRPFRQQRWQAWQMATPPPASLGCLAQQENGASSDAIALLAEEVAAHNALAAVTPVTYPAGMSGAPPQWYRVFTGSWRLQGRWYAVGAGGDAAAGHVVSYASLKATQRSRLRMADEAVVELDVSASHLTLLLGLLDTPLPEGDPYERLGYPREIVKQWVMEACGKGRPPTRWSSALPTEVRAGLPAIKAVGAAVIRRFPQLEQPALVVPEDLPGEVGQPAHRLVPHYLAAREAEAMTLAMRSLRQHGILALPVHDSLIVPASAEAQARRAITAGYLAVCGQPPRMTIKGRNV